MAASAAAARTADGMPAVTGLAVLVAGGLIEGTALGVAQSTVLASRLGAARRRAWVLVTVLVAGVGWAAGSAPATLGGSDGASPPLGLIVLGAAGLGLGMGALLGLAQAAVLRRQVRHPWRWVPANALGWAVAMAVIFTGASTAGASWPLVAVVGYGALTGAIAGAGLGAVTGLWLEVLDGPPLRHRLVLSYLVARRAPAVVGYTALAVTGARSGQVFRFPVMCAPLGPSSMVVLPGRPDRKTWWQQLGDESEVAFLDAGVWVPAQARVVRHGSVEWSAARDAYIARWRRVQVDGGPLVTVDRCEIKDQSPLMPGPDAVGLGAVPS